MKKVKAEYMRQDERGALIQLSTGLWKQINILVINKDKTFGGHYHKERTELFHLLFGELKYEGGILKAGETILIEPMDMHTFTANHDSIVVELLSEKFNEKDTWKQ